MLISNIIRLYYGSLFLKDSNDVIYSFYIVGICTLVEATCGNLVLCLPFLPKALEGFKQSKVFMKFSKWRKAKGSNGKAENQEISEARGNFKPREREWIRMSEPERERGRGGDGDEVEEDFSWISREACTV